MSPHLCGINEAELGGQPTFLLIGILIKTKNNTLPSYYKKEEHLLANKDVIVHLI